MLSAALFLFAAHSASAQLNLQISTATLPDGATFKLLDRVPWAATIQPVNGAFVGPAAFLAYVTGQDIYGNPIYIEVGRGVVPNIGVGGTFQIREQFWPVPNDGTLFNMDQPGLQLVISLFPVAPTSEAEITAAAANPLRTRTGRFLVDVIPDLAVAAPALTYRPGDYRGGDVLNFTATWSNRPVGERPLQSRPLRPGRDGYSVDLRLSENASFNIAGQTVEEGEEGDTGGGEEINVDPDDADPPVDEVNDDFKLMAIIFSGDLAGILPDGSDQFRRVQVVGTPGPPPPYGIPGIIDNTTIPPSNPTERNYTPQPDDGFLDIGEGVILTSEQLVPRNFEGDYFVAMRLVTASDAGLGNNVFVSNAANKITIDPTNDPELEPASAISTQDGQFIQGGNAGSADGGISDTGTIVFASRASNLLVPPTQAAATVPPQFVTSNNQILLKLRDTREVFLASRTAAGVQANADCFDPFISAEGRYVAFHSVATNLVEENTGGRSMIYVYDTLTRDTVVVSRNAVGALANGDSYNAALSASGRFVVFESVASNLDAPIIQPVITGGQVRSYLVVTGGSGYQPFVQFEVAVTGGTGTGARGRATVGADGSVIAVSPIGTNFGGGYLASDPPTVIAPPSPQIYPPSAAQGQVYLHDRNVTGRVDAEGFPVFDEPGNTRTYLVSVGLNAFDELSTISDNLSFQPVINANDSADDLDDNGGMFVAFSSYASNLPAGSGYAMVYRARVDVVNQAGVVAMEEASVNNAGTAADLPSAPNAVPFNLQPSISGDGSQVAFTSWSANLVYDPADDLYNGDTNRVQDVFVRNFRIPTEGPQAADDSGATVRVSVSEEKVATGTLVFGAPIPTIPPTPGSIPNGQPAVNDVLTISTGTVTHDFVFGGADGPGQSGVPIGLGDDVFTTRDNLLTEIFTSPLRPGLTAVETTPPNAALPGTAYRAAIYLKNEVRGTVGNVDILINGLPVLPRVGQGGNLTIFGSGMSGAGTQAEDNPRAVQDVPFGSNEPSIDRSGRYVAFRTIAGNLDVYLNSASRTFTDPAAPITGELIRPLLTPGSAASNVYIHDRNAQDVRDDGQPVFDLPYDPATEEEFTSTRRVSVNRFGYPTYVTGNQESGVNANSSANSSSPYLSPNGRYVVFTSTAPGIGGLVFGPNNLTPLDNASLPDVFVADLGTLGDAPPQVGTRPSVTILSPPDGLEVAPGTEVPVYVTAFAKGDKTLVSAELFVNNASQGALTSEPFLWSYTVPSTGTFVFRVVVTDSKGLTRDASVVVRSEPPLAGAPLVEILQPTGVLNFAAGSTFFINGRVTATSPAEIVPSSVSFTVNGVPVAGEVGILGNRYGVLYTPSTPNTVANLRVVATDNNKPTARTGFSPPIVLQVDPVRTALPEVFVRPLVQATPVIAGSTVQLQAEALFFGPAPSAGSDTATSRDVEFYVNNVFVGRGTAAGPASGGRTLYVFNFETPEIVDSAPGPEIYSLRARAVDGNEGSGGADTRSSSFISAVSAATALSVSYVPTDPAAGSNEAFIIDNFETIFFRKPNFDEYQEYLDLFAAGLSQAQIVEEMLKSPEFAEFQQVLFGYYLRMGLVPASQAQVLNYLNVMRSANGRTLLPDAMSAGLAADVTNIPQPYGATVGQAEVASALLNTPTLTVTPGGTRVSQLQNQPFRDWMLRTFNVPYLPAPLATNQTVAWQGDQATMLTTIAGPYPTAGATPIQRYGASYAFISAMYASINSGRMNPTMQPWLTAFPGLVRGIAFQYLYKGTWSTSAPAATATEIAQNLVPGITSAASVNGRAGALIVPYQITTQNAAVTQPYAATGLPPGLTLNAATGLITGSPTAEGEFNALLSATNANGTGTKQVIFTIVAQAPSITSAATANDSVNSAFSYQITCTPDPAQFQTTYILTPTSGLPAGLSFNETTGEIFGTPTEEGTFTVTVGVQNSGGSDTLPLSIEVGPPLVGKSAMARWLEEHNIVQHPGDLDQCVDGDGACYYTEFAFGMDPTVPDANPWTSTIGQGKVTLLWTGRIDGTVSYVVRQTPDLPASEWSEISLITPPSNVTVRRGDVLDAPSVPRPGYEWIKVEITIPEGHRQGFYKVGATIVPSALP